ncbi:MAG TPA: hypothetical protein ENJ54_10090 [Chloroflexi bacterium]|nr:hypothetical protein [Chloroflexota bacterium]
MPGFRGCSDARMLRCPDAQMPGCSDARMLRCPDAQMPGCSDARMPGLVFPQPLDAFVLSGTLTAQRVLMTVAPPSLLNLSETQGHTGRDAAASTRRPARCGWPLPAP